MKCIRYTLSLPLTLCFILGLLAPATAEGLNSAVRSLDNKSGKCPCFDKADLANLISTASDPFCTYTFNVDRRLRIFDAGMPSNQAFTRAGVACFGPKVSGGNAPGLPGVGSFAMYDKEGRHCRNLLLRAANMNGLLCQCINQDGQQVDCPASGVVDDED